MDTDLNFSVSSKGKAEHLAGLTSSPLLSERSSNEPEVNPADDDDLSIALPQDWPVLLLPVRLETRFLGDDLCIRIYPDQIFVDTHRPELSPEEETAGKYFHDIYTSDVSDTKKQDAWRNLARDFGPQRAAWIFNVFEENKALRGDENSQSLLTTPKLRWLPERFCAYLYYRDRDDNEQLLDNNPFLGNKIVSDLAIVNLSSNGELSGDSAESPAGPLTGEASWMVNFEEAEARGMAIRVKLVDEDKNYDELNPRREFSRIIVVGVIRIPAQASADDVKPDNGVDLLSEIIESHHYSTGLGFVPYGTPTNNTQTTRSGHSESTEDREESYKIETQLPEGWESVETDQNGPRMNAERLGVALGLMDINDEKDTPVRSKVLSHLAHAGNCSDDYAKLMQTALWPASADYFLHYLTEGIVSDEASGYLERHFKEFVRARGPLPAIRVGNQPYGILPVTSFRAWKPSTTDNPGADTNITDFDEQLHSFLLGLLNLWLKWANDPARVPRVGMTDDPTDELKKILSMEPASFDCAVRPWVDERFIAWLITALKDQNFGEKTPFPPVNEDPEYWIQKWAEIWRSMRHDNAEFWRDLSGVSTEILENAPFLRLLSWGDAKPLSSSENDTWKAKALVSFEQECPGDYLAEICRILREGEDETSLDTPSKTVFRDMLIRAIRLIQISFIDPNQQNTRLAQLEDAICGSALLRLADIKDALSLITMLSSDTEQSSKEVSQFIWAQFSPDIVLLLTNPDPKVTLLEKQTTLVRALNKILQGDSIYDPSRFAGVVLRSVTQSLLTQELSGKRLICLNRLLLEDAYPLAIVKSPVCEQIAAIETKRLCNLSDEDIERLLLETFDLLSHRLDAWITSFATKRLRAMRADPTGRRSHGIYLGAYGWVENLIPSNSVPQSWGYIHAPSQAQAAAAAVLYNGYRVHENDPNPNPFRINLNSERVRRALHLIDGIRQGQSLGVLLGYQFERQLHEQRLDFYIDRFRSEFPSVANKVTAPNENESIEVMAARNVVDGLALARWWENLRENTIDSGLEESVIQVLDGLLNSLDAAWDTLLFQSTYDAVQGRFERAGAALDAASGNGIPPEIESVRTPLSGRLFGQRVCLLFFGEPPQPASVRERIDEKTPRELAEPRLAAWIASIFGNQEQIACRYTFPSTRINLNTASAEEIAKAPGIDLETSQRIMEFRTQNGPIKTFDDLRIPEIDTVMLSRLNRWTMTGFEENESDRLYQRVNINADHSVDELADWLDIDNDEAESILLNRPFGCIGDLAIKAGLEPAVFEVLRPWITAGHDTLSLYELNIGAVDLLYLSGAELGSGESEIEQRIAYWVRREYALDKDVRISIQFAAPPGYQHGLDEALELAGRIRKTLGRGSPVLSDTLFPPFTAHLMPLAPDLVEFKERIMARLVDVQSVIDEIGNSSNTHDLLVALERASSYGVPGSVPLAPTEPELQERCQRTRSELEKRRDESRLLIPGNDAFNEAKTSAEASNNVLLGLMSATRALFGRSFLILPVLKANEYGKDPGENSREHELFIQNQSLQTELTHALAQTDLLAGQGEERLRLWLQQAGETHLPLRHLEDVLMFADVWKQSSIPEAEASMIRLQALQLPFVPNNRWLGLSDTEKNTKEDLYPAGSVSTVAVIGGFDQTHTNPADGESEPLALAGLLLDQWEESIPDGTVDTSVTFQYSSPNAQAPQALLLAVPSDETAKIWKMGELAEIVKDTMDLLKARTVDPNAMGEMLEATEGYQAGVGSALPVLMLDKDGNTEKPFPPTDFPSTIEEWLEPRLDYICADFRRVMQADVEDIWGTSVSVGTHATIGGRSENMAYLKGIRYEGDVKTDSYAVLWLKDKDKDKGYVTLYLDVNALSVKLLLACRDYSVKTASQFKSKKFIQSVADENGRIISVDSFYQRLTDTTVYINTNNKEYPVFEVTLRRAGIKSVIFEPQNVLMVDQVCIKSAALEECFPINNDKSTIMIKTASKPSGRE